MPPRQAPAASFDDEMTSLRFDDEMTGHAVMARSAVINGRRPGSCGAGVFSKIIAVGAGLSSASGRFDDEMTGHAVMARSAVINGPQAEVMRRRRVIKNHSCPRGMDKRQQPF